MKRYCALKHCRNQATDLISLHRFPVTKKIRSQWLAATNIRKSINHMYLCSEHFNTRDFFPPRPNGCRSRLYPTAIPTRNLKISPKELQKEIDIKQGSKEKEYEPNKITRVLIRIKKDKTDMEPIFKDIFEDVNLNVENDNVISDGKNVKLSCINESLNGFDSQDEDEPAPKAAHLFFNINRLDCSPTAELEEYPT